MPVAVNCVFELATAGVMLTDRSERLSPQANRAIVIVIRKQRCEAGGSFVMKPLRGGHIWSGRRGSNPRHRPWQGRALPLSYSRSTCKIINDAFTLGQRRKRSHRVSSTEAVLKSNESCMAAHARLAHSPLRIFFRRYDATIPHMNDAVAIFCSLGIVGDHQDGLP
jgi:hypothetical protein